MSELSICLTYFAPSRIGEVFNLAARLKSEGKIIYDLPTGKPDFATDPEACGGIIRACEDLT